MKKIRMAFFALATLTLLATSTGCGGGGGGDSDDDDGDNETPVAEGDYVYDFDESLLTQDCYQTAHVKVENVAGGLKFTITRPENKYYDPNQLIREGDSWYEYVEDGAGDYIHKSFEYVGAGKGDHKKVFDNYSLLPTNTGDYVETGYEFVGEGNGTFDKVQYPGSWFFEYVGPGNGNLDYDLSYDGEIQIPNGAYLSGHWKNVGAGQGSYKITEGFYCTFFDWDYDTEKGNGSYMRKMIRVDRSSGEWVSWIEDPMCKWVGNGNGDYKEVFDYVGEGNGYVVKKTDKIYGGVSGVQIWRYEPEVKSNGGTTRAELAIDNNVDTWTCFYPLCEAGERYIFDVEFLPNEDSYHREAVINEWVSITAQGGIGDIDYSTLNENRRLNLTYDGEKPISTISNYGPPVLPASANNLASVIEYFAGTTEWKPGTTYWIAGYRQDASNMVFNKDPCIEELKTWASPEEVELYRTSRCFNATVRSKGKNQFFSEQFYKFLLPEAQGITEFRTMVLRSNFAYMN